MTRPVCLSITFFVLCSTVYAGKWAPVPVEAVASASDYVVLATVAGMNGAAIHLTIERWLKGQTGSADLSVGLPPVPANGTASTVLPRSLVGQRGLWFVQAKPASPHFYEAIPLVSGVYRAQDLFLPIASSTALPQQPGEINQQILAALVAWYQGLAEPSPIDDLRLLASFEEWRPGVTGMDPGVLLAAAAPLTGSVIASQRLLGLVISIRLGVNSALAAATAELASLSASPKFPLINEAIASYPHDAGAIPGLATLAGIHSPIAGLDNAVATALDRIGGKTVVPVMVTILDSRDSEAQLRAAAFLGRYSLFADANGNVPVGSVPDGPFATPQTRQYMPGATAGLTTADYVSFWKSWWVTNSAALGFAR